ncbi:peptidyl-alpha-hydroxyglycine alpha-amidating lyase family protein [Thermodesulfobacteriota bacterium]
MNTIMGAGEYTYEVDVDWVTLPEGWTFHEVADVAVDSQDQVYVFNRGKHPMIIFDREGNFLSSWGEDLFKRPHGVSIDQDDMLFCVDDGDHTVRKCTSEGEVLMTIGTPGQSAPFQSGRPFNRPTKVALDPKTGEFYVSDGYGNSHVHKYSPDGKLLFSWGGPGTDPGEFNIVHTVCTDNEGFVYITDRENHRVQIFDPAGKYITQWNNLHRPCGICIAGDNPQLVYIGELAAGQDVNKNIPNLGARISIFDINGNRLARLGDRRPGEAPNQFIAPHSLALDSRGDIYVGEVSYAAMGRKLSPPRELRSFRKLIKR